MSEFYSCELQSGTFEYNVALEAAHAWSEIARCSEWNGVAVNRHTGYPSRWYCRLSTCPKCGAKWKARNAKSQAHKLAPLLENGTKGVRPITINYENVPDWDVSKALIRNRKSLKRLVQRRLRSGLIGTWDFALSGPSLVKVHFHGMLVGEPIELDRDEGILRRTFTGARQIHTEEPFALTERIPLKWLSYVNEKSMAAFKHHQDGVGHKLVAPIDLLRWIALHRGLSNEKGNSIRVQFSCGLGRS